MSISSITSKSVYVFIQFLHLKLDLELDNFQDCISASTFKLKWNFEHCIEVRFASFLSGGFTTMAVINPLERKLAKRTSVCTAQIKEVSTSFLLCWFSVSALKWFYQTKSWYIPPLCTDQKQISLRKVSQQKLGTVLEIRLLKK